MQKRILLLALLLLISSCESMPKSWNWGIKPRPLGGVRGFPEADTNYGRGFRDGCTAGFKTTSRGLLGDVKVRFDAEFISKNVEYSTGWSDGYVHCVDVMDWELP